MKNNQEVKQALRDAIAQDQRSDADVEAAAEEVMSLIDDSASEGNEVEQAVVEVFKNRGLATTFGEETLVTELEDLGYVVSYPEDEEATPPDDRLI